MKEIPFTAAKFIDSLRAHFFPRDRDIIPAEGRAVVVQSGLLSDRPATPIRDGHLYYGTDTNTLYVGDAGSWVSL